MEIVSMYVYTRARGCICMGMFGAHFPMFLRRARVSSSLFLAGFTLYALRIFSTYVHIHMVGIVHTHVVGIVHTYGGT